MLTKVPHEIVSMENGSNVHAAFCRVISSALTAQSEEWRKGENQILSVQWWDLLCWDISYHKMKTFSQSQLFVDAGIMHFRIILGLLQSSMFK